MRFRAPALPHPSKGHESAAVKSSHSDPERTDSSVQKPDSLSLGFIRGPRAQAPPLSLRLCSASMLQKSAPCETASSSALCV